MNLGVNYKQILSNFLGDQYKGNLPVEDMEMFCLLTGVGIARTLCKLAYSTVKVPSTCENGIKHEEKQRLTLYNECHDLVKGYICEIKTLGDKSYYDWYKKMHRIFETDKEFYTEKCKKEAYKIVLAIYEQLMKRIME